MQRNPVAPRCRALGCVFGAVLLFASASACGPVQYVGQVTMDASSALAAARSAGGVRHAPYEMTMAEEFLHKAREEAGYARYQTAIRFGRKAEQMAVKARALALEGTEISSEDSGDGGDRERDRDRDTDRDGDSERERDRDRDADRDGDRE